MANLLNFKMGLKTSLTATSPAVAPGTIYVTTDERAMYIDVTDKDGSNARRIRLGDFRVYATFAELQQQPADWTQSCLYYVVDKNALAYYSGTEWTLINDTADLSESIKTLTESLGGVVDRLDGLGTTKGAVKAYIDEADQKIKDSIGTSADVAGTNTVYGAIATNTENIAANANNIAENADNIEAAVGRIDNLEAVIGTGGSISEQITDAINALDADVTSDAVTTGQGLQVQVVEVDGKITDVNVTGNFDKKYDALGAAAEVQSNLDDYEETVNEGFESVRADFAAADSALDEKITTINNELEGLGDGTGAVKTYIDAAKQAAIDTAAADATTKVNKLGETVSSQGTQIESHAAAIGILQDKDTELASQISTLQAKVNTTGNVKEAIATAKQEAISAAASDAAAKVKALEEGKVADNTAAIDNLKSAIEELQDADSGLTGRVAALEEKVDVAKVSTAIATAKQEAIDSAAATAQQKVDTLAEGAVTDNAADIKKLQEALEAETNNRTTADTELQSSIDTINGKLGTIPANKTVVQLIADNSTADQKYTDDEIAKLQSSNNTAIQGVQEALANEVDRATKAEEALSSRIKENEDKLVDVTGTVGNLVSTTATSTLNSAKSHTNTEISTLKTNIEGQLQTTNSALETETSERKAADTALENRIAANETKLANLEKDTVQASIDKAEVDAIAAAKTETTNQITALANGQVATNKTNIENLTSSLEAANKKITANENSIKAILNDTETDGVLLDSFADVRTFVADRIGANDAMKFMGTVGNTSDGATVTSLPTDAQAGHTYKVVTSKSYAGHSCKVGDLLIALVDDPTNNTSGWAYVPSGGEDYDNLLLTSSAGAASITIKDDLGVATGTVNFTSGNDSLVIDGAAKDQIVISMVWGTF